MKQYKKIPMLLRYAINLILFAALLAVGSLLIKDGVISKYFSKVLMLIGINIILTVSLNLVNGYMGEFSIGHAGFMALGAYSASYLTVRVVPSGGPVFLQAALLAGGLAAAVGGLLVALPSFRTRGDYLAIVTLAFMMIVKSLFENLEVVGGARGFLGMERSATLPVVYAWTVLSIWLARNVIYSRLGRGIVGIREDELVCDVMGARTRRIKVTAFVLSAFLAGIAGGLYAHVLQFISPRSFDILKSTDILVMVYLGGVGSIGGSILGATIFTVLMEVLRPFGVWRMVLMPLLLVLLMLFRPRGILGLREFRWLVPAAERTGRRHD